MSAARHHGKKAARCAASQPGYRRRRRRSETRPHRNETTPRLIFCCRRSSGPSSSQVPSSRGPTDPQAVDLAPSTTSRVRSTRYARAASMSMYPTQQKEQFSIAYLRAVVAVAGYNITSVEVDEDSIDLGLRGNRRDGTFRKAPVLDVQANHGDRRRAGALPAVRSLDQELRRPPRIEPARPVDPRRRLRASSARRLAGRDAGAHCDATLRVLVLRSRSAANAEHDHLSRSAPTLAAVHR